VNILLAGGGSAGHINPMLAVSEVAKKYGFSVIYLVGNSKLDNQLLEKQMLAGEIVEHIKKVSFPRPAFHQHIFYIIRLITFPIRFVKQIIKVLEIIKNDKIDICLGFGGYISPPAYIAAKLKKVPIYIHEANLKIGLANKLGSRFAKRFFTAFPDTQIAGKANEKIQFVGLPLRKSLFEKKVSNKDTTKKPLFSFATKQPVLLVLGGSLGAKSINKTVKKSLPSLLKKANVIHITGAGKQFSVSKKYHGKYKQFEYLEHIEQAYKVSDFAISRAGAGSVLELSAVGLPACFVPLDVGNGEQSLNASYLVKAGAGIVCADKDFSPEFIENAILPILLNKAQTAAMREKSLKLSITDAAEKIIQTILTDIKNDD
jgi:UDP-N-acetylglucosamine--N-acetylmuramyl-(pentapeptide) pyrophosphoryl-undecaprenol N-acetylglucosamine transferase